MQSMPQGRQQSVSTPTGTTSTPQRALGLLVGVCFAGIAATALYAPQIAGDAHGLVATLAAAGISAGLLLGFMPWQRFAPWWFHALCAGVAVLVTMVVYASGGATSPFSALFFVVSACVMLARHTSAWVLVALIATLHGLPLGYDLAAGQAAVQLLFSLPVHLAVAAVAASLGTPSATIPQTASVAADVECDDREPSRDPLTGLQTSAALADYLHEAQALTAATRPFSILSLGVDEWAALCDKHGRASGDDIMRQIAALLQNHSRSSDIPTRYDDHTFVVIFPGASAEIAMRLGERIRIVIEQHRFWTPQSTMRIAVGVSLGVAAFPHDGASADALTRIALGRMRMAQQAHTAPVAAVS